MLKSYKNGLGKILGAVSKIPATGKQEKASVRSIFKKGSKTIQSATECLLSITGKVMEELE